MNAAVPFIPENITVHLGPPDSNAENVTLPFIDYIKNVASSEIYPTWPESALRANIYAQISFALNRIYTEYYRARGYDFDITNSTAYDQSFVQGRDIFENIDKIVGEIFNSYIVRQGFVEPLFAQYCNGTTVICDGLSQWGTVDLANQGLTPYEILQYYYGDNINLVTNAPVQPLTTSVPDFPLRLGRTSNDIKTLQIRLNRIAANYPSIPKIAVPDGTFSYDTEQAVKRFQQIFSLTDDGIVGQATWYKILQIYNAVKRLNELNSEGLSLEDVTQEFNEELRPGDTGNYVRNLQFYINYLSDFYDTIPSVRADGIYGDETMNAVSAIQRTFGLPVTGIVDEATWEALYQAYLGIVQTVLQEYFEGNIVPFSGVPLRLGVESEEVRILQEYLNYIAQYYPEIPTVNVTGYFGNATLEAVTAFQNLFGIEPSGTVGLLTWDTITEVYGSLYNGEKLNEGQYPGYSVGS